jgi:hypothetical protein
MVHVLIQVMDENVQIVVQRQHHYFDMMLQDIIYAIIAVYTRELTAQIDD